MWCIPLPPYCQPLFYHILGIFYELGLSWVCDWIVPMCLKLIGCTLVAKGVTIRESGCSNIYGR